MDVLSDVLSWLRVKGNLTRRSEFSAPWGISYPSADIFSFLAIEKGGCFLLCDGEQPVALEAGDLVMFCPGHTGSLADQPSTPTVPYAQVLQECSPVEPDQRSADRDTYPTLKYGGGPVARVAVTWPGGEQRVYQGVRRNQVFTAWLD